MAVVPTAEAGSVATAVFLRQASAFPRQAAVPALVWEAAAGACLRPAFHLARVLQGLGLPALAHPDSDVHPPAARRHPAVPVDPVKPSAGSTPASKTEHPERSGRPNLAFASSPSIYVGIWPHASLSQHLGNPKV